MSNNRTYHTPPSSIGDRVVDREDDNGSEPSVLAVGRGTTTCKNWIDSFGKAVAAVNHEYNPKGLVITVALVEDIEREVTGWRSTDDLRLAAVDGAIRTYDDPVLRVEVVD